MLLASLAGLARAQEDLRTYEVAGLELQGNKEITDSQILNTLRTRETPSWLWKFIYRNLSEKLGYKPELFDPIVFASDDLLLAAFYKDQGFYHAKIDTTVEIRADSRELYLKFYIREGPRSFIDTIEYRGLKDLPVDLFDDLQSNKLVEVHQPFIPANVEAEVARIVKTFANNGYVNAKVDTPLVANGYASTNNFSIVLSFTPGKRYLFGDISVRQDTVVSERIDTTVVLRHLDYEKGDFYSELKKTDSERNLSRLGIFEASKIENVVSNPSPDNLEIPTRIVVRPRPFQELTPEIGINDQDNALNILTGIGYNNRNFFGGARNFLTRTRYSLQSIENARLNSIFAKSGLQDSLLVSKLEFSMALLQPYFVNNKTTIGGTFSYTLDKRPAFYSTVLNTRITVTAQTGTYTRAFLDWDLRREDPTSVTTQQSLERIENYTRQFNSIITLTVQRDKRNDLFYPSDGFFHSLSIQEAGTLPRTFGGLFGTNIPYSQYIKIFGLGQWYWDPTGRRNWIWAAKLKWGTAWLYGDSQVDLPLTEKFFVGGSGSIRGWKARELGAVPFPDLGGNALVEGSLEGRWSALRGAGRFLSLDLEKFSVVLFYDFGNIWTEPKQISVSEIAMAAGFGLRYDTVAGPIRIDFGTKLYDPSAPPDQRWITQQGGSLIVHFGVGHAF